MKKFQKALDKITSLPVLKRRWPYILGVVIFTILFLAMLFLAAVAPVFLRMAATPQMQGLTPGVYVRVILFAALDVLCIFMLVWIRRRKKRMEQEEMQARWEQAAEGGATPVVLREEENKHPYRIWIVLVVIALILILLVELLTHREGAAVSQTASTLHSGVAERTDLEIVLPGAGTLTEEDPEDYTVPEGVEMERWYVSNGDEVEEGDLLAMADQVSVMDTIVTVQEKLEALDAALAECESRTDSDSVTAPADGRVIRIYASVGTPVVDTMYEDSALMLLSLDGMMAVSLRSDVSLRAGDEVTVTLPGGTQIEGRVDSLTNRTAVITVPDDVPELGDTVSVKTADGEYIGRGKLYIHSEWKAVGFVGTVSDIPVTEGSRVGSGDTLLTLTDTADTATYEMLLEQRRELEMQMAALFQIYTDGYIYAPCSGVISGLDTDTATERTVASASYTVVNTAYLAEAPEETMQLAETDASEEGSEEDPEGSPEESPDEIVTGDEEEDKDEIIAQLREQTAELEAQIDSLQEALDAARQTADEERAAMEETIRQLEEEREELENRLAETANMYENGDSGNESGDIDLSGMEGLYEEYGDLGEVYGNIDLSGLDSLYEEYGDLGEVYGDIDLGDMEGLYEEYGDLGEVYGDIDLSDMEGLYEEYGNLGEVYGDIDLSDLEGFDRDMLEELEEAYRLAGEEETGEEEEYGISEQTLLSITPQEKMTFTITVDEMDILKLVKGMTALVTLDAFPGQSFTGTITAIHRSGENSGGSTKYTADITIDREAGMLDGMNASAQITLETVRDVLCIPEAALVEENGLTYVYTTYSEEDDELGGRVEVTTGISDGTIVEILSGLGEGSEYYYRYLDVVNYESASSESGRGFF